MSKSPVTSHQSPVTSHQSTRPVRIELPTGLEVGSVNAYLFIEPEPVLVDTGVKSDESWAKLQAALSANGLAVSDIRRVIITHPHVDHFGQAGTIAAHSDAQVWVAGIGYNTLLNFHGAWQQRTAYYRDVFLRRVGLPAAVADLISSYTAHILTLCDPIPAERVVSFELADTLSLGEPTWPWQVLAMPGHASTQTCFYQPETRQFLSADMLLARTPAPVVEQPPAGGQRIPALPQFLESLDRVEALDIDVVYPGHGEPFGDHRAVVQYQRRRIHARKLECLDLIEDGHVTVADLLSEMYATYPLQFRFVGLWMLVGYLDLLKAEGLVEEREVDGVWYYRPTK